MKKVNFDSFKRIHASEELIQKTLALSEEAEQKAVILPWYRRTKMIAAAAGIVLAATIGLLSYFVFRKNDLPVKRSPMIVETAETYADPTISNESTGSGDQPETADPSVRQNTTRDRIPQPATQIATDSHGNVIIPAAPNRDSTEKRSSAVPATEPAKKKPSPMNENIFVSPSEGSRETAPTDPAEPFTEETMEPEPWEPIVTPTDDPWNTTEAQTEATLTFRASVNAKLLPQSGRIYCRIYDRKRKIVLGNADRYHDSHRASYTISGTQIEITYCPSEHGITVPPGDYAVAFHDENGKLLIGYHQTVT